MNDETFGPVAPVSARAAASMRPLMLANRSRYALGATVYTTISMSRCAR